MLEIKELKNQNPVEISGSKYKFDGKLSPHLDKYPWIMNKTNFTIICA